MLVLGIELESFGKKTGKAPNLHATLPSPRAYFLTLKERTSRQLPSPGDQVWGPWGSTSSAPPTPTPTAFFPLFTREPQKRECKTRQERKKTAPAKQTQALATVRAWEAQISGAWSRLWGRGSLKHRKAGSQKLLGPITGFLLLAPPRVRCPANGPVTLVPRPR